MGIDALTLGTGLFSFIIFLLIHVITFRRLRPEHLLKSLVIVVGAVMLLPLVLLGAIGYLKFINIPTHAWVLAGLLAMLIDALLCFVYVLCIFGPYETSVRMRLVREIERGGSQGITRKELLNRYSAQTIVNIRLQRLVGSGDIIEKQGLYGLGSKGNFFFLFDAIAVVIKKWIGR